MEKIGKDRLLREFKKENIIIVGPMTRLQSGLSSPIYVDLRAKLYERPELLWALGKLIAKKIIEVGSLEKKQKIIAVPDAANPMAVAASLYAKFAMDINMPIIVLRKAPKEHGTQKDSMIIGKVEPDAEFNLVDDVITSSASKKKAIEQLAKEGIRVTRVIVVVDRQQGGKEALEKEGYEFCAIFKILDIADQFLREGLITDDQHKEVADFIKNNRFD